MNKAMSAEKSNLDPIRKSDLGSSDEAVAGSPTERAFKIIELTARKGIVSTSVIIETLKIPRPTVGRLVTSLEEYCLLRKAQVRGHYIPGQRLIELSEDILRSTVEKSAAQTTLRNVRDEIGETCSLAFLRGGRAVYLSSVASDSPLTLQFEAGQQAPLHCTSSGRLFLADMSEFQFRAYLESGPWIAYTKHSITEPSQLVDAVETARKAGFATTESELVEGVLGIAVPVRRSDQKLVACLGISAPTIRRNTGDLIRTLPHLQEAAMSISNALFDV